jgi:phosphoribosylglycinamide formyltransferase 2
MVTMITQSQTQFALHVRAILGLPLDFITYGAGASAAYKSTTDTFTPTLEVDASLFTENSFVRVFGKPQSHEGRRLAVALTYDKDDSEVALLKAKEIISKIKE